LLHPEAPETYLGTGICLNPLMNKDAIDLLLRLIPCTMGANASQLEKDIGSELFPANEHFFGLVG